MAGRGTDIKLSDEVKKSGDLQLLEQKDMTLDELTDS